MSALLDIFALMFALAAFLGASFYALVVLAGVLTLKRAPAAEPGPIAVVIPAHDEGAGITHTIADIRAQLRPQDRLYVVADNCADDTASIAANAGAAVLERRDAAQRGKGHALQFAIDHLRAEPPAIVCFVDADCRVGGGAILAIAGAAEKTGRPAQALDLMAAPANSDPRLAVAEFAWLLINRIRIAGLYALFDVSRLCGTGMAFPFPLLASRNLATSEIVEDLALGLDLAREGSAPVFCPNAVVKSEFPRSEEAAVRQRARWEHGSLRVASRKAPALALASLLKGDIRTAALASDVMIPPLTIFFALLCGVFLLSLIAPAATPFAAAALGLFAGATLLAWATHGRAALPPRALTAVAAFILDKAKVHGPSGRASTSGWARTDRDERQAAKKP